MANSFVITGQGFYKGRHFDADNKVFILEFTDKLREAHPFNASGAGKWLKNNPDIQGFVYKPWAEEKNEKCYEVVKENAEFPSFETNALKLWKARKTYGEGGITSDASYLKHKGKAPSYLYTKEEAEELAKQRNLEDLQRLQNALEEHG